MPIISSPSADLDEAADGFGALNFHILMRDPIINRLHFVLSPLWVRVGGYAFCAVLFAASRLP
jgi:hypothetical protein